MFEFRLANELRKRKIKLRFKEYIEPQETFLDSLAQKKEREFGISEKKFETPLSRNILRGFFILFFVLIFILFVRTFQFQVIEGKDFEKLAEQNKFRIYQVRAERGVIYDKDGNQLVWNKPSFDLILDKNSLPRDESEKEKVLSEVSLLLNRNLDDLKKQIGEDNGTSNILISENLDSMTLISLEVRIGDLAGFQIRNNEVRDYRAGADFSHLLGYTGKISAEELKADPDFYSIFDWTGKDGLEKSYEDVLRKNPGKLRVEKDAFGNVLSQEVTALPESGKSLVLWLDSGLQKKITEELENETAVLGTKTAAAVAMDPKTGGILAMVSLPDFDNNLFQKGGNPNALKVLLEDDPKNSHPLLNRVIAGLYPTGSTIKPLEAAAALQENIISPDKQINDDKGYITIPNPWDPSSPTIKRDWSIHGWVDMRSAIAQSCDVYFYTIGGGYKDQPGLGPTRIKKYLDLFGWDDKTGIDLPGETAGFVPDKDWKKKTLKENWVDGDTYNLAIGQGFLQVTPLEVVTAFSAIANGGKLLQPQMVQKVIDSDKNTAQEFQPKIIRENFIDPENLQVAREGMRWAVTGENSPQASSIMLGSLPVAVAAKTGTAELGGNKYHNWVTVFAPYDDPQIVLTVVLENVRGVQTAALPVARNILQWYFSQPR
jgi:penicillin-binding protein 2